MGASAPCCSNNDQDSKPESVTVDLKAAAAATPVLPDSMEEPPAAKQEEAPAVETAPKDEKIDKTPPAVVAETAPAAVAETAPAAAVKDTPPKVEDKTVAKLRPSDEVKMREGKIADSYDLSSVIGEGAFGQVFRAKKKDTQALVAVKTILFMNWVAAEFEKEVAVAKLLRHPNIAYLHDIVTDNAGKTWYIVTDMFDGGCLFDLLTERDERAASINEATLARYTYEMLDGIKYFHYHNLVHRDIKLENYMREYADDAAPLKLIDFGEGCTFTPGVPLTEVKGTMAHAAPELLKGSYNEKADVWSIGTCVYFLATSRKPFRDPAASENALREKILALAGTAVADQIRLDEGAWSVVKRKASDGIDSRDIIQKMLDLDPEKRPSCKELMESGDRFLAKRDKATHQETFVYGGPLFTKFATDLPSEIANSFRPPPVDKNKKKAADGDRSAAGGGQGGCCAVQ